MEEQIYSFSQGVGGGGGVLPGLLKQGNEVRCILRGWKGAGCVLYIKKIILKGQNNKIFDVMSTTPAAN